MSSSPPSPGPLGSPRRSRSFNDAEMSIAYSRSPDDSLGLSFSKSKSPGTTKSPMPFPSFSWDGGLGGPLIPLPGTDGDDDEKDGHLLFDFDLSDEEDDLVQLEDNASNSGKPTPHEMPLHTATLGGAQPPDLLDTEQGNNDSLEQVPMRRLSSSGPQTPDLLDTEPGNIESLDRLPMRRVSSTPVKVGVTPAASQTRSLPWSDSSAPPKNPKSKAHATPPTDPYGFRRQVSLPVTPHERDGVPPASSQTLSATPSSGSPLPSKKSRTRSGSTSTPPPTAPYVFRRQLSLPVTPLERGGRLTRWDLSHPLDDEELLHLTSGHRRMQPGPSSIFRVGGSFQSTPSNSSRSTPTVEFMKEHRRQLENSKNGTDTETGAQAAGLSRRKISIAEDDRPPLTEQTLSSEEEKMIERQHGQYIIYLSTFAIFGSTLRVYISRFFGADCEAPELVYDFLSPLFRKICVTASGRTLQTGGALFLSLPANMIGCFIMGLVSTLHPEVWPAIPWLRADHPLQQHDAFHVALRTGFCGSLTTFASWNAQMIVMLDGSYTELGSQIIPALFGYTLGLLVAIACFLFGTQVSTWLNRWKNPTLAKQQDSDHLARTVRVGEMEEGLNTMDSEDPPESGNDYMCSSTLDGPIIVFPALGQRTQRCRHAMATILGHAKLPFLLLACLLTLYAVGDGVMEIPFYRSMWLTSIFTPPGVLLRWNLSKWNSRISMSSPHRAASHWIPWGTFVANLSGSLVSILLLAVETKYYSGAGNEWAVALLNALRVGFAGSLSTVSAMAKEAVDLATNYPHHAKCYLYPLFTILCSGLISLCIYSPIVR